MESTSLDDLFEQMDHFESRGSEIVVARPVFSNIDDMVLKERAKRSSKPRIPERTTYFGFFDPEITRAQYIISSSQTYEHGVVARWAGIVQMEEERRSPFDKVSQRELCAQIGIFNNPRYLDTRKLFSNSKTPTRFRFVPKEFSNFPHWILDDLFNWENKPKSYIFQNTEDGFRIRGSKKQGFTVYSEGNMVVKEANQETKKIRDPHQRLDAFLAKLIEKEFSIDVVGYKGDPSNQQEQLLTGLLVHNQNLYIKDARTGGGYLVVKVCRDGSEIKSDSPDFQKLKEAREKELENRQNRLAHYKKEHYSQGWIDQVQKEIDEYDPQDKEGILVDLFKTLNNPLIEEESPYEAYQGGRAEFRLICQRVNSKKGFQIEPYAKVSASDVSTNISLGGRGELIHKVIAAIYQQRKPELTKMELLDAVHKAIIDLSQRTRSFAEQVYQHYRSTLSEGLTVPRDFAVDLIPVWDEEKDKLDYDFLEINRHYGYSGLMQVNEYAVALVNRNKRLIEDKPQDRV